MPLNVQYHKHPSLHFAMERTWFILLVSEPRTRPRIYFTHFQRAVRITVPRKNPKSERAVRRGLRFWFLFREDMIICRCQKNSRTFSSAIVRVWELMRPGFEPVTFLSADGPLSNLTRWHLCSEEGLAMESSLVQRNILRIIVSVWPVVTYMYFT